MRRGFVVVMVAAALTVTGCQEPVLRAVTCQTVNTQLPVVGPQPTWASPLAPDTTLRALGATWSPTDPYPVTVLGTAANACLVGGSVIGTWPATDAWSHWHDRAALRFSQPRFTVFGVNVDTTGDGIKPKDGDGGGAQDFDIIGNRVAAAHDDCVENDYVHAGAITDNLLDGCYVMLSARPASGSNLDGTANTLTVTGNVGWLEPMPTVYKGPSPGTGGFFKWSDRAPRVVLTGNTLLAFRAPNHGDLGPPSGLVECSGNSVVWLGAGPFPAEAAWRERCPDTVITTDPAVFGNARTTWLTNHHPGA